MEVLEVFDELAKPELKNRIMIKIWQIVKDRTFNIILRKPEEEINDKLLIIHQKLSQRFKDLDNSIEINAAEQMGSVKIPDVGELSRVKKLTSIPSAKQAEEILKELNFA